MDQLAVKFNPNCYESGTRIYNPIFTSHGESEFEVNKLENDMRYTNLIVMIQKHAGAFIDLVPSSVELEKS